MLVTVELPKEELVDGNGDEGESNTQLSDFLNVLKSRRTNNMLEDVESLRLPSATKSKRRTGQPKRHENSKARKKREEVYVFDKIVEHRDRNNVFEFKIRWEGYGEEDDTWEPSLNIPDGDIIAGYFASLKPT